jgi:hypothetical protein
MNMPFPNPEQLIKQPNKRDPKKARRIQKEQKKISAKLIHKDSDGTYPITRLNITHSLAI